jgi:hypothetical protein
MSLHRATLGQPARALSIAAAGAAALGIVAVVVLIWFLAHIEFTF